MMWKIKAIAVLSFVFALFEFDSIVFQTLWSVSWLIVLGVCMKKMGVFEGE